MKYKPSQSLVNFIKEHEKFSEEAYPDAGNYAVGYGSQFIGNRRVTEDDTMTKQEATQNLKNTLDGLAKILNKRGIPTDVKQHEFDANLSTMYNMGPTKYLKSDLYKKFKEGEDVSDEFNKYNKSKGKRLGGLSERREQEAAIYRGEDVPISRKKMLSDIYNFGEAYGKYGE